MLTTRVNTRMLSAPSGSKSALHTGVIATLSVVLISVPGFAALYLLNDGILPAVFVVTISLALGILAGFTARWSLRRRNRALRWLVAMAGLSIGMLSLGWLSLGAMGIDLRLAGDLSNWEGLAQFSLSGGTAWLAIFAWSSGEPRTAALRPRVPLAQRILSSLGLKPLTPETGNFRPATRAEGTVHGSPHTVLVEPLSARRSVLRRIVTPRARRWPRSKIGSRLEGITRSTPPLIREGTIRVRLSQEIVEERCPYCLEVIAPGDARGIVMCETCRTAHHADCWSVTGTCQIPHHHAQG